jgi:hypothetical protein
VKGQHLSRKVKIRYRSRKRPQVINTAALAQCAAGPLDRNVGDPFAVPQLICGGLLSRAWVGRPRCWVRGGRPVLFLVASLFLVSVSGATRGQTDMRGLVTAGRAVRLGRFRCSRVERDHDQHLGSVGVHSCVADRPSRCDQDGDGQGNLRGVYSMTASDQAQPASSRATATLATTGRLRRAVNASQR